MESEAYSLKIRNGGTQKGLCAQEPHSALLRYIRKCVSLSRDPPPALCVRTGAVSPLAEAQPEAKRLP